MTAVALVWASAVAFSQNQLVGHTYSNPNIMQDEFDKMLSELEHSVDSAKTATYERVEKEKGRKLTAKEKAAVEKEVEENMQKAVKLMQGISTGITMEFKNDSLVVLRVKMKIDEEAMKAAGIGWAKRKLLKGAMKLMPETEKDKYRIQGNKLIIEDEKEPDTLTISSDWKTLTGMWDSSHGDDKKDKKDKKKDVSDKPKKKHRLTKYVLTRTK
jgi:hypothetical protein